jgi:hypothetical protein
MFGHSVTVYCYLRHDPKVQVFVSLVQYQFDEDVLEKKLEIKCCCYRLYYNKDTEEFVHHCAEKGQWLELPWDEWVDIERPDETKTFSYQAKAFSNRILGC